MSLNSKKLLLSLGLTTTEVEIYLYLIRQGAKRAVAISKGTGLGRTNVYNHLELLESKGLVKRSPEPGVALFIAEHPDHLAQLVKERKTELELAERSLAPAIDELTPLHEMAGGLPGVYTFHGKDGLHAVYDQILKDGLDVDILQNRALFRKFLAGYNDHFVKMRRKKRIKSRVLTPNNVKISTDDRSELREVRYLDRQRFPFEMDIKITDKMVAIATLKEENPIGLVVSNAEIIRNFRVLFEFLWGIGEGY